MMNRIELDFERPRELESGEPPERRGTARDDVRLLVSTENGHEHAAFADLPRCLKRGSLLVVNTSGTLAASLPARHDRLGPILINLSTQYGGSVWLVEPRWSPDRPGPLPLEAGEPFEAAGLAGRFVSMHPGLPRLWFCRILGDVLAAAATAGTPIRYSYLEAPYPPLDAYQTIFARTPGSAEMPSAARPFTDRILNSLRDHDIEVAGILLHAGVSSQEIDADTIEAQILHAEPFEVTAKAAAAVNAARAEGRPVIAVGTTVVRALESAWDGRKVRAAAGFTRLFVHPARPVRSVDGLLTGFHDPVTTHLALLYAVAPRELVRTAYLEAVRERYLWHEFGDSHLILARAA